MKAVILLLFGLIFIVLRDICSADSILSKFHQNTFKLKDVRIQVISYNEDYINILKVTVFKYNRTTAAHNVTFNFKCNVEDKLEIVVQAYKFLSNEYRHFPLRFQVNLKKYVDANALGLGSVKKCGNTTTIFFYKNITYYFCNFVFDETRFPPLIPNGKYKWEAQILYLNHELAMMDLFHEIYIPTKYPKN